MTKSPAKKQGQKDYLQTGVRLPPNLAEEIKSSAERHGRSMNAEIIARLQENPTEAIMAELAEMKRMLRAVLDQI